MRARLALAAVLAAGVAVLGAAPAASAATRECDGLQICVPIAGPWVVVPTGGATGTAVEFQLECPRGYIVGGLDAELSTPAIDVTFTGTLGSPVNPGITTSTGAVFSARYVGLATRAAASLRPHVGCIPASGGGGRVPTASNGTRAVFPPGRPTVRRVYNRFLADGVRAVVQSCASGERLLAGSHAVAFTTQLPPTTSMVRDIATRQVLRGRRVAVTVRVGAAAAAGRPAIQVSAICTGGK